MVVGGIFLFDKEVFSLAYFDRSLSLLVSQVSQLLILLKQTPPKNLLVFQMSGGTISICHLVHGRLEPDFFVSLLGLSNEGLELILVCNSLGEVEGFGGLSLKLVLLSVRLRALGRVGFFNG